jgi:hypothetical protein
MVIRHGGAAGVFIFGYGRLDARLHAAIVASALLGESKIFRYSAETARGYIQ